MGAVFYPRPDSHLAAPYLSCVPGVAADWFLLVFPSESTGLKRREYVAGAAGGDAVRSEGEV